MDGSVTQELIDVANDWDRAMVTHLSRIAQ